MDCQQILRRNVKTILLMVDALFMFLGMILVMYAAAVKAYYQEYQQLVHPTYLYASDLLLIVGSGMIMIWAVGFFGRLKDNATCLSCFSFLIVVLLLLEVTAAVAGVLMKSYAERVVEQSLNTTILQYGQPGFNETTDLWDRVQNTFHCCGVVSADDWSHNNMTHGLPLSCCHIPAGTTNNFTCSMDSQNLYKKACLTELVGYVTANAGIIEGWAIGISVFQLLMVFGTCYLVKHARSDYETV